ncbi:hypothetical protein [Empedobacter sp. 189-2]|uniref:hypothetical protein n=1 Tax=Empedobacter sp. 189-2 TaxID=2746724 RepID=UPI00257864DF|nr:hypothetical protein [Empedobacter sp. 189-2]MDM1542376.1 hypothetical protein [Empedobacter sp. 189-2]
MNNYHNIEIDDIDLIDDEYTTNVEVVSLNLDDFNERFGTDIHLLYSIEEELFYPIVPSQLGDLFCDNINDLLFMVHNPSNDDLSIWNEFVSWKMTEVTDKNIFKIWFSDYYPAGIELSDEVKDSIIKDFNQVISTF